MEKVKGRHSLLERISLFPYARRALQTDAYVCQWARHALAQGASHGEYFIGVKPHVTIFLITFIKVVIKNKIF
jgi:hypothetical protein